ncbi:hypothetical protein GCM10008020_14280 [Massilia psychrophila]|nr:hypothetical protein GCM10008020_14280 [Massilia psychrophila]
MAYIARKIVSEVGKGTVMACYFALQHKRSQGTFLTVWKRPKDHQLEMMGETFTRAEDRALCGLPQIEE